MTSFVESITCNQYYTQLAMKRISILLSLMAGFILACSCVSQEDIEKLQNQIDQQNSRIQTSIAELENTDKALKEYIEDLKKTAENLPSEVHIRDRREA